ncbi:MerR family transcriptional regulator, partial [Listeria monocytogenes]|nr:MerR family transcriptional regulator [Listeria monocytogenes]
KDYVTLVFEGDTSTIPARKEMLAEAIEALNSKKDDISKAADYLQWKIDNYDTHMTPTEENLK